MKKRVRGSNNCQGRCRSDSCLWTAGLEASSFAAALAVGFAIQLLPSRAEISRNVFHVVGCIPMIPGAFAAKAILGLFAIAQSSPATNDTFIVTMESGLRVMFTVGALGTGLAIPSSISITRTHVKAASAPTST